MVLMLLMLLLSCCWWCDDVFGVALAEVFGFYEAKERGFLVFPVGPLVLDL